MTASGGPVIHTKPETQMIQVVQLERGLQAESRIDFDRLEAPREFPSSVDKGSCPLGVHDAESTLRRQWRLRIWSLLRSASSGSISPNLQVAGP